MSTPEWVSLNVAASKLAHLWQIPCPSVKKWCGVRSRAATCLFVGTGTSRWSPKK